MLWSPSPGLQRVTQFMDTGTTNMAVTVTTSATPSTKGTPVQVTAGVAYDVHWVTIVASGLGSDRSAIRACLDLLLGASTEEVAIANMLAGQAGAGGGVTGCGPKSWNFPLHIPANTRISLRAAGDANKATSFQANVYLHSFPVPPVRTAGAVTTYGVSSVPAGVSVAPGASGAEGSWVEITSSTTRDHFGLVPSFQGGDNSSFGVRKVFIVEFAVGAAGAEEALAANNFQFRFRYDTKEQCEGPLSHWPLYTPIPSGSRLSCRISASSTLESVAPEVAIHALS